MAVIKSGVVGKIQGTAYVVATLKRPSPIVDPLKKYAIKETRETQEELKARVHTLIYAENSVFPKAQETIVNEEWKLKEYRDEITKLVEKYKKSTINTRKYAGAKAQQYFDEYGTVNIGATNDLLSNIQGIYSAVYYPPFNHALAELCKNYAPAFTQMWKADATSLSNVYKTRYKAASANQAATVFWNMRGLVQSTSKSTRDDEQKKLIEELLKKIDVLWETIFMRERMNDIEASMLALQQQVHSRDIYISNDGGLISQLPRYPDVTTLRPFDVVSIQAEDAPLLLGYPTVSPLWVRCRPVLNSSGDVVSNTRPVPAAVNIDSQQRWVADPDFWDPISGTWTAINNDFQYRLRAATSSNPPLLVTTTTSSGNEVITRNSFRISGGSKFHGLFGDGLDSLNSFTLSMVIAPNPTINAYPVLDYWHDDEEPATGERFAWWITDKLDFYYGDMGGSVDQLVSLGKTRPLVITSVVDAGMCRTYIGYSPKHNMSSVIKSKVESTTQWMRFQVGGTYTELDEDSYADFNLYEINLWSRALDNNEVLALHSDYYAMYGVGNDWR